MLSFTPSMSRWRFFEARDLEQLTKNEKAKQELAKKGMAWLDLGALPSRPMQPKGGTVMPVMSGFGALAELPWERVTDKIERRVLAGQQGMIVWWKMKAGAHAAAHQHPHEQIVWMLKGKMDFRIGNDRRSMVAGDVAVIPGHVEHEGIFPEDTEVVDIFAPPREDFLTSDVPPYMRTS
jgi:quercetin dioxygenase-like cupin family protein